MTIFMFYTTPIDGLRYYFDLDITEVSLILHTILHELDTNINKRLMNFTVEQCRYYYKTENKKYTLIVYFTDKILGPIGLSDQIKNFPKPLIGKRKGGKRKA